MDYLDHGRPSAAGVPDLVVASWERSRVAGVDITQPRSVFTEDVDTDSLLARCARPVLEQLGVDTADLPLTIGLTDRKVRVIQRIDPSSSLGRLADGARYAPGFDFSEAAVGTNGAGTVFEAGQPVSVVGQQHFVESLRNFAASGAPIIDPITGRIEGVVAIASLAQEWNPIMLTLVKSAANEISRNLLLDRSQSQHAIFDAYLRVTARSARQAVFAFGDAVWIASPAAQHMFDPGEQRVLREHATFLLAHRERSSDALVLPGSQRLVRIRGRRIFAGDEVAGMLVIAEPATSRRDGSAADYAEPLPPRTRVARQPAAQVADVLFRSDDALAGGRSPAWVRACDELREALDKNTPALLVGESGVGKFTLATELFRSAYPRSRSIAVGVGQLAAEGLDDPVSDISPPLHNPDEPTLYIVRDIDQVGGDEVEALKAYFAAVESLDGPRWVVATASQSASAADEPFRALLRHFETAITVPPLRFRTDDLPGVVAALLRGIAPERTVRLSSAAQRRVARYEWPRNISQLREALVYALRHRPVGEIQEVDLPGYCQTASRRALTPLEVVERDAIVAALQAVNGNRVAAAAHLGMSRSSLYRKLKTYGITT